MVLFVLSFLVAEGPPPLSRMTTHEQLFALGMALLFLGLVAAWFSQTWGGLLSVAGWLFLLFVAGKQAMRWPFVIPAAIGVLHVLCGTVFRGRGAVALPRGVWGILAIFVVLCANEMFGNPPLMTPAPGVLPPGLAGTWVTDDGLTRFTIQPDGNVTGSIGGTALNDARLTRNRSWFGRILHWRTDYIIRGSLSGAVFAMPFDATPGQLDVSVFLPRTGPTRLRLTHKPNS